MPDREPFRETAFKVAGNDRLALMVLAATVRRWMAARYVGVDSETEAAARSLENLAARIERLETFGE